LHNPNKSPLTEQLLNKVLVLTDSLCVLTVWGGFQDWNYCFFEDPPTEFSLTACFLFRVLKKQKQEHGLLTACQETERGREVATSIHLCPNVSQVLLICRTSKQTLLFCI